MNDVLIKKLKHNVEDAYLRTVILRKQYDELLDMNGIDYEGIKLEMDDQFDELEANLIKAKNCFEEIFKNYLFSSDNFYK